MDYRSIYTGKSSAESPDKNKANIPSPEKKGKFMLAVYIIAAFVILGAVTGIFLAYTQEVPEVADLRNYKPNMSTAIYDNNGNLVSQLFAEQRTVVKIAQVPLILQNAILSKEDPNFYQHSGFDIKAIIRATVNNLSHGKIVEGASTITQQLARNLFLNREKTIGRKIKEALLALQIEKYYTKSEILELYCNQIFFGAGAYGVEAASRTYFGKHVEELTLPECAVLAALPQAPSSYNPYRNPDLAMEKRNVVLNIMAERGVITPEERDEAINTPLILSKLEVKNAPYFVEYVRQQLEGTYGNTVIYKGGLKVYTTLDTNLQNIAQDLMTKHVRNLQAKIESKTGKPLSQPLQGALIAMEPSTGNIKAMIGGLDYNENEFNRAVQAKRQTGSAFKPIVYTSAIDNGFRVSDVLMDSPIVYKNANGTDWRPENYSGRFSGPVILLNGLAFSMNVVTVKLLDKIGIRTAQKYAHKMGISSSLADDLTLGLGSSSISLLEMTTAFATLANGGMKPEPLSVLSVKDNSGKELESHISKLTEALPETTAYIVTFMMENVIDRGTGASIRRLGFTGPAAGKTGTTNEFTDTWFIGFTPRMVLAIWIGCDTKENLGKQMTGGYACAPLWAEIMLKAYGSSDAEFPVPNNIVFKKICVKSGMLADKNCPAPIDAPFVEGTEPVKYCTLHSDTSASFMHSDFDDYESGEEAPADSPVKTNNPDPDSEEEGGALTF
ncbi:MAG: PBP1A family penicillin-binding protein [Candidatus Goldbacteria bacterium]|nr:PBP1A family penicillin-binding protein [Candidatus Goldiibacteriota bacterium]